MEKLGNGFYRFKKNIKPQGKYSKVFLNNRILIMCV